MMSGLIEPVRDEAVGEVGRIIRAAFRTVADEFGLTMGNAPRHSAFMTDARLRERYHRVFGFRETCTKGFPHLPFTVGFMEREIG